MGAWVDLDTDLGPSKNGRRRQVSNALDVSLADSSTDAALVDIVLDATHSVGFSLEGAAKAKGKADQKSVTYSKVRKDTDVVITSRANGIKEELVLTSPAAPDRFVFPLKLRGLTASIDDAGDVVYRDDAGAERARTPHGFMTDSNIDPLSDEAPTSHDVNYALIPHGKGTALEVRLDRAWLDDPARHYPVVVDPQLATAARADDTYVMNSDPSANASENILKVGTFNGGYDIARAFMHFDTGALNGAVVTNAQLHLAERWSYNCAYQPEPVWRVASHWDGAVLWPNQPATDPGAIAGGTFANAGCHNRLAVWDVTSAAAGWAANPASNFGLSLRASNEYDSNRWKKYASTEDGAPPALHVTYNHPPVTPWGVAPIHGQRILGSSTTVSAYYADADVPGGNILFGVWNANTQLVAAGWGTTGCNYCQASWTTPALADGWYQLAAIAHDGASYSPAWSAIQWFFLDTTAPLVPSDASPPQHAVLGPPGQVSARYTEPFGWQGHVLFQALDSTGSVAAQVWSGLTCSSCMATANLPLTKGDVYKISATSWDGALSAASPAKDVAYLPIETSFELSAPASLAQVQNALNTVNPNPVEFRTSGNRTGGYSSWGQTLPQAITDFRSQYAMVTSGEPMISRFTVEGSVPTNALGQLSSSVSKRTINDPVALLTTRASTAPAHASGPASNSWAPAVGKIVLQQDHVNPGKRFIYQELTWAEASDIASFGPDAFEQDLKFRNDDNLHLSAPWPFSEIPGVDAISSRPICFPGDGDRFWIARRGVTFSSTFPADSRPYFDIDALDSCTTQDFTFGLLNPTALQAGITYTVEIVANAGSLVASPFDLAASRYPQYPLCPGESLDPWCVGINIFNSGVQSQVLVEDELAPGCFGWERGLLHTECTNPNPPPQPPPPPPPPLNHRPVVNAGPLVSGNEGTAAAIVGSANDPDGDLLDTRWNVVPLAADPGTSCEFADRTSQSTTLLCDDNGTFLVTLTAHDGVSAPVTSDTTVVLANLAPVVAITAPVDGALYGAGIHPVTVRASLSDGGSHDSHSCSVQWETGIPFSGSVDAEAGTCTATHQYATAGQRSILVAITDDDGGSAADSVQIELRENAVGGGAFAAHVEMTGQAPQAPVGAVHLPPEGGGPYTNSVAGLDLPGLLSTGLLEVRTAGQRSGAGAFVESSATQASAAVGSDLALLQTGNSQCHSSAAGSMGSAPLARLQLGGQTLVDLTPAPNTVLAIPGGLLVLNEQVVTNHGAVPHPLGGFVSFASTTITVNGAHLILSPDSPTGAGSIILSQSRCSLEGPTVGLAQ